MHHLNPKQRTNPLSRTVKRYSRLVTFVGATIVFLTFVVKEGWREHLKNLVDTADSAQRLYTLRADSVAINAKLNGMTSEIEAIRAKITGTEWGMTLVGLNRTMLIYSGEIPQLATSADNLAALAHQLPNSDSYNQRLDEINQKLAKAKADFRSIGELMARATPRATPGGQPQPEDSRKISDAIFAFSTSLTDIYMRIDALNHEITDKAETARRDEEHSYKLATWFSYVLYGIGWAVGLVGRLAGLEDSSDIE